MKVAVATGTRADFGLLRPLIQELKNDDFFTTSLWVTAMHLSDRFGNTINEIINSGFKIDYSFPCLDEGDDSLAISRTISMAIEGFSKIINEDSPDFLVILGDRTEILGAAIAATVANLPIIHIHGGETTIGAYDESIRHSITKMSYLHFTAASEYRDRVIQLGEHPNRVFDVGAIGIDSIKSLPLMSDKELEDDLNFKFDKKNILITYHPVTLESSSAAKQFEAILKALDELEDTFLIFTHANSDKDGKIINEMIDEYTLLNNSKSLGVKSLGQLRYFSMLENVDLVLGNSSSGILEVPYFNIPTINIGDRQTGRLLSESVIQCANELEDIKKALKTGLDDAFAKAIKSQTHIYGNGTATQQIIKVLKNITTTSLKKPFYDLPKL
ncbi:UDP-N-acetylglucosamine 2-epimerase [uncultured Nonlabens sp.]|uniref:UDP-N-acetylglucosamine 2-epimerase n=1 Tax=uncultured Nonlabens sp. TaxID=859306 RepID=UPI0026398A41|nr:UDP-N-acetylglucosamine 2-epimerase [uncultured Nonlabens sp.]